MSAPPNNNVNSAGVSSGSAASTSAGNGGSQSSQSQKPSLAKSTTVHRQYPLTYGGSSGAFTSGSGLAGADRVLGSPSRSFGSSFMSGADVFEPIIADKRVFDLSGFFNERAHPRRVGSIGSLGSHWDTLSSMPSRYHSGEVKTHPIQRETSGGLFQSDMKRPDADDDFPQFGSRFSGSLGSRFEPSSSFRGPSFGPASYSLRQRAGSAGAVEDRVTYSHPVIRKPHVAASTAGVSNRAPQTSRSSLPPRELSSGPAVQTATNDDDTVTIIPVFHIGPSGTLYESPASPGGVGSSSTGGTALRTNSGKIVSPSMERLKHTLGNQASAGVAGWSAAPSSGPPAAPCQSAASPPLSSPRSQTGGGGSFVDYSGAPSQPSASSTGRLSTGGSSSSSTSSTDPKSAGAQAHHSSAAASGARPGIAGPTLVFVDQAKSGSEISSSTAAIPAPVPEPAKPSFNCHRCKRAIEEPTAGCRRAVQNPVSAVAMPIGQDGFPSLHAVFHEHCFHCYECDGKLLGRLDQLNPIESDNRKIYPVDYLYLNNRLLCSECSVKALDRCQACGQEIRERLIRSLGLAYHPRCFCCSVCGVCLDNSAFTFDVHKRIYCLEDFHNAYAPKCAGCGKSITPVDGKQETKRVVSKNQNYHLNCFSAICPRPESASSVDKNL